MVFVYSRVTCYFSRVHKCTDSSHKQLAAGSSLHTGCDSVVTDSTPPLHSCLHCATHPSSHRAWIHFAISPNKCLQFQPIHMHNRHITSPITLECTTLMRNTFRIFIRMAPPVIVVNRFSAPIAIVGPFSFYSWYLLMCVTSFDGRRLQSLPCLLPE